MSAAEAVERARALSDEGRLEEAAEQLRAVVEADPAQGDAWAELGSTYVELGRLDDAVDALGRAADLVSDTAPLVDLAHLLYVSGRADEAVARADEAVSRSPDDPAALRAALELNRSAGRAERAYELAERRAAAQPDDVLATLDLAELALELDRLDEAVTAFARLRGIDDDDHEVYAVHGLIEAEIKRDAWRRALDLAVDATRVDRLGRTTDILAYVVTRVFGAGDRPAPSRDEVDSALADSRNEHRLLHVGTLGV